MRHALLALVLMLPLAAGAVVFRFDDPAQEARFQELSSQLRCLVCQGQSVAESNADLAVDLKREVHRMILEGKSDAEIIEFMTARYGDFVLFKPPVRSSTWLLWFGPFLLLAVGAATIVMLSRRRGASPAAELGEAERARARALLEGKPREGER